MCPSLVSGWLRSVSTPVMSVIPASEVHATATHSPSSAGIRPSRTQSCAAHNEATRCHIDPLIPQKRGGVAPPIRPHPRCTLPAAGQERPDVLTFRGELPEVRPEGRR